uniref:Neuronal acetylcholine receptor subunit beta-2-like n=1 Tax=Crassostrea virginica TaxID=6565 RepID=A0A8B8BDU1_CRAVI|nr:neuronal acetylcholine receptor subunit beta-2-like [Crassostrea virginica]XP_022301560.1 neuronal acetylcholine receptor subunit beta-2-like [Crassostrea virginica]
MWNNRLNVLLGAIFIVYSFVPSSDGYSSDQVKNLTKYLFETNAYDKTLRPATNQISPTDLKVSFYLIGLNKLDELEEKLTTTAFLTLEWKDEFLAWDLSMFPVQKLTVPQDKVWKPDFVLKNGFTEFKELGASFYNVILSADGTVFWKPYQVFESQCSIDVTYFPFDTQTCEIQFTLWSHFRVQVMLSSSSSSVEMLRYKGNSIWDIISTSQSIDNTGGNSEITYTLTLKRKPTFYVSNTVIPILFLGVLNLLVFVIPADAGEKMSYAITVALGFIVFLTIISSELPANSDSTPYLSTYLQIQIFLGGLALVISSIQLRLRHKPEDQPVYAFLQVLVKITHCKNIKKRKISVDRVRPVDDFKEKSLEKDEENREIDIISWNDVSSAIDFLMFWFYVIIYCISSVVILTIIAN